ncbi:hypothetical protein CASFOL_024266 [Castilleja foliolosa]|uniref:Nodule Cysteine-Rich (NCR) secreted peptide n=1 Tax=Castilleja foliolosa TaxID=1961234 RepID=A0ABD3CP82_9LAMI
MASQKLTLFFAFFLIAQGLMVFAKYPPIPCQEDRDCDNVFCPDEFGIIRKCVNGICMCVNSPPSPSRDGGI